ncbi:MAG: MarR family winged helix-turn-helix transcriptional regulator [Clostridia bacterium]
MVEVDTAPFVDKVQKLFPRIMRHLERAQEQELTGLEVRPAQMTALIALSEGAPRTMGVLAWDLGLTESATTRLVDRLVDMNLVRRERDRQDRRVVRVRLSSYGRQLVHLVLRRRTESFSLVSERMTVENRQALLSGLEALNAVFEEMERDATLRKSGTPASTDPA